jgi:hypothetical protein
MSEINKLHYSRPSGYHQNSIFSDKAAIPLDMDGMIRSNIRWNNLEK